MDTWADEYRRRGNVAQRLATQSSTKEIKETFEQIARHWFVIAKQVEWLERHGHSHPSRPAEEHW